MPRTEPAAAMRVDEHFAQRLLLRAGAGKPGEPRPDATVGRAASGISGVWQPTPDGLVGARGPTGKSQTGEHLTPPCRRKSRSAFAQPTTRIAGPAPNVRRTDAILSPKSLPPSWAMVSSARAPWPCGC